MKKSKISIMLSMLFFLVGCTSSNVESATNQVEKNSFYKDDINLTMLKERGEELQTYYSTKEKVSTTAIKENEINNLNDVITYTEISVMGIVIDTTPFLYTTEYNSEPYTKITFQVTNVLIGGKEMEGTEIIIYEAGGLITKEELGLGEKDARLTNEQLQKEVVVNFDGVPNLLPGQEATLFLVALPKESLGVDEDFYQIWGNYITRFDKNDESGQYNSVHSHGEESVGSSSFSVDTINTLDAEVNSFIEENMN